MWNQQNLGKKQSTLTIFVVTMILAKASIAGPIPARGTEILAEGLDPINENLNLPQNVNEPVTTRRMDFRHLYKDTVGITLSLESTSSVMLYVLSEIRYLGQTSTPNFLSESVMQSWETLENSINQISKLLENMWNCEFQSDMLQSVEDLEAISKFRDDYRLDERNRDKIKLIQPDVFLGYIQDLIRETLEVLTDVYDHALHVLNGIENLSLELPHNLRESVIGEWELLVGHVKKISELLYCIIHHREMMIDIAKSLAVNYNRMILMLDWLQGLMKSGEFANFYQSVNGAYISVQFQINHFNELWEMPDNLQTSEEDANSINSISKCFTTSQLLESWYALESDYEYMLSTFDRVKFLRYELPGLFDEEFLSLFDILGEAWDLLKSNLNQVSEMVRDNMKESERYEPNFELSTKPEPDTEDTKVSQEPHEYMSQGLDKIIETSGITLQAHGDAHSSTGVNTVTYKNKYTEY